MNKQNTAMAAGPALRGKSQCGTAADFKLGGRIHRHRVCTLSMKLRVPARSVFNRTVVDRVNPTFEHFHCPQNEINPTSGHLNPVEKHLQLS